jgi:hypothetical protein
MKGQEQNAEFMKTAQKNDRNFCRVMVILTPGNADSG